MKDASLRFLLSAVSVFALTGCATIVNSPTQEVLVNSNPSLASVRVMGDPMIYETPCVLMLQRNRRHLLRVEKDGYHPVVVEINQRLSTATMMGSVPTGGLGVGVDVAAGTAYDLLPSMLNVALQPLPKPEPEPELAPLPLPLLTEEKIYSKVAPASKAKQKAKPKTKVKSKVKSKVKEKPKPKVEAPLNDGSAPFIQPPVLFKPAKESAPKKTHAGRKKPAKEH